LEVVRQLFEARILKSAFWHQFALTVHSPIGKNPSNFEIEIDASAQGRFANNDLRYTEKKNKTNHDQFSFGLKKALFNYMHEQLLDARVSSWFDFKVPEASHDKNWIQSILDLSGMPSYTDRMRIVWLGGEISLSKSSKNKKGVVIEIGELVWHTKSKQHTLSLGYPIAEWFVEQLHSAAQYDKIITFGDCSNLFQTSFSDEDFELLFYNKIFKALHGNGLIII
jgi:hypothetical protein